MFLALRCDVRGLVGERCDSVDGLAGWLEGLEELQGWPFTFTFDHKEKDWAREYVVLCCGGINMRGDGWRAVRQLLCESEWRGHGGRIASEVRVWSSLRKRMEAVWNFDLTTNGRFSFFLWWGKDPSAHFCVSGASWRAECVVAENEFACGS
ncbi:hypothetical protein EJ04DRAFT_161482 [Polyplosphaeria fusca]|uniref:Uncharacterized protein n=1 Tax=Polyplosphaeria fusca TaxID=682080 RepID=A0A9P4V9J6_9PLEO|nr:hypothetical protein EJ04DRAFT_161482 [Polyplosphaeria fusca]